jgi:hypothetical protein
VQQPQIACTIEFTGGRDWSTRWLGTTRADGRARVRGGSSAGRSQAKPYASGRRRLCAALLVGKQLDACIVVVQQQRWDSLWQARSSWCSSGWQAVMATDRRAVATRFSVVSSCERRGFGERSCAGCRRGNGSGWVNGSDLVRRRKMI